MIPEVADQEVGYSIVEVLCSVMNQLFRGVTTRMIVLTHAIVPLCLIVC